MLNNLNVLIVEDDETSVFYFEQILGNLCKSVISVGTAAEAVAHLKNFKNIDLVLMDIKLPDKNGYCATEEIRQFDKKVKIVAQTAYAFSGDREKSIAAGCNAYLSKPVSKSELLELLESLFKE